MPKKTPKALPDLSPAEMQMLERLIDAGILIAVPPKRKGKPRPVISASIIGGGKNVLLYLSQEPVEITPDD
jgi:hypothetical protein